MFFFYNLPFNYIVLIIAFSIGCKSRFGGEKTNTLDRTSTTTSHIQGLPPSVTIQTAIVRAVPSSLELHMRARLRLTYLH